MVFCSPPRQLFSGWHCDPGLQSDNGTPCHIGNESARARFAFGPPCGASSRGRALIFLFPLFSMSHKDQTGPRSTRRPRPDPFECSIFPSPMQRLGTSMRRTRSQRREMYWPRPPDPSWSSPHQRNERQGRCGGLWNLEPSMAHPDALRFIPRELLLRTKRGRVAWACSANMLICFVIRVLTTATAQWAVGNVTVADEGCDDGRGEYSNLSTHSTSAVSRSGSLHLLLPHSGYVAFQLPAATLHRQGRADAPQWCSSSQRRRRDSRPASGLFRSPVFHGR